MQNPNPNIKQTTGSAMMALNIEGLPIEGIDRIQITLNPRLKWYIDYTKKANDYLRIDHSFYIYTRSYVAIQAQRLNITKDGLPVDIRYSIAEAITDLIKQGIIKLPVDISLPFIYAKLEYFVYNIREIEFYFDFRQRDIHIVSMIGLSNYKGTIYSGDYRSSINRPKRVSRIKIYNKAEALKGQKHTRLETIANNPYKKRLEFRLTMYNSPDRSLANLDGSATDVIQRYSPYLATVYYRQFFGKVAVEDFEHPLFGEIQNLAAEGKLRYRGNEIVKAQIHRESSEEKQFFDTLDRFFLCAQIMKMNS